MWIETIYPNADENEVPSSYIQEFVQYKSFPNVCLSTPLFHRYFDDVDFDEKCFLNQGFEEIRANYFLRSITREEFIFILDQYLNFTL